jgi:hypothetical protein
MADTRMTSERDTFHASRARRREAALVAEYIHELSDRHNGSAKGGPATEGEPAGDGPRRDESG